MKKEIAVSPNENKRISNTLPFYRKTMGYLMFLRYYSTMPYWMLQAVNYGEVYFPSVGFPDEELLEKLKNACQTFVDTYYPGGNLEVDIQFPTYQRHEQSVIYKELQPNIGLSIQNRERKKQNRKKKTR